MDVELSFHIWWGIAYLLLGVLFLVQLFYNLYYYRRLATTSVQQSLGECNRSSCPPLSVIICGENQLEEIQKHLPLILEQDYSEFEVIYVDMASTDDTAVYLESLSEQYNHFYYTIIPESAQYISRRKLAQTLGVKASKYDWLVFTEADCQPVSKLWLQSLAFHFKEGIDIVLGYSRMAKEHSWLSRFSSYDNLLMQMRYLSFALADKPYMGMGRNMAYRKSLFYQQRTYANQLNLQRGEDELFLNQRMTAQNTAVVLSPESIVQTAPFAQLKHWKYLKGSHLLSMQRFKGKKHWAVGFETTSRILFTLLFVSLLVGAVYATCWVAVGGLVCLALCRWLVQSLVTNQVAKAMGEERRYRISLFILNLYLPIRTFLLKLALPKRGKGDIFKISDSIRNA